MKKTLCVADCPDWAISSLVRPLKKLGVDLAYHYVNTTKNTGTGEKNPIHLTVNLLKNYEQIHFHTIRAVDSMLRDKEVIDTLKGKRLIMTIHTEREADLQLLKGDHWHRIDDFVSPTICQKERVRQLTGKEATYIPYAIDEKKYTFTKEAPRGVTIGYVGRIVPHKRLKLIVEAAKDYKVVAIGYVDREGDDYWRQIPKNNLTHFQSLSEDTKIEIMRQFTVLVSISEPYIEAGPLPVIECAALGIPIITTDVGWAKDNLDTQSAVIIGDNLEGLSEQIEKIIYIENEANYLRENARKVVDNWTLDKYVDAYGEVYALGD